MKGVLFSTFGQAVVPLDLMTQDQKYKHKVLSSCIPTLQKWRGY